MSKYFFTSDDIKLRTGTYIAYEFFSGAMSGLIAISSCYPLDMLRRMMQLNGLKSCHNYSGYGDLLAQVYRKDGVPGFYRGFTATCLKVIPATAILFICNNKLKTLIIEEEERVGDYVKLPNSPVDLSQKEQS